MRTRTTHARTHAHQSAIVSLFGRHSVTQPSPRAQLAAPPVSLAVTDTKSLLWTGSMPFHPSRRPPSPLLRRRRWEAGPRSARRPATADRPAPARPARRSGRCHVLRRLMVQFRNNLPRPAAAAVTPLQHTSNLHCLQRVADLTQTAYSLYNHHTQRSILWCMGIGQSPKFTLFMQQHVHSKMCRTYIVK